MTRIYRAALLLAATLLLAGVALGSAFAQEPDYQGTYAGVAETSTGRMVPFTAFIRDIGERVSITVFAEGYSVHVTIPEVWAVKTLGGSFDVPDMYSSFVSGDGDVSILPEGSRWIARGSGRGTALRQYDGSVVGDAKMITRTFDFEAADKWHLANPAKDAVPYSARYSLVPAAEKGAAVVVPRQPPLADPEKLGTLALMGLIFAVGLLEAVMFGWYKPERGEIRAMLEAIRGRGAEAVGVGGDES